MSKITTHILDTSRGRPAANVAVPMALRAGEVWKELANARTDALGRVGTLLPADMPHAPGTFRLRFDVAEYFRTEGVPAFFPYVEVVFEVHDDSHYHFPLLLSPFGYSTYRGG